jgi:hypothetical protein
VTYRPDVHVRLRPLKLALGHFFAPFSLIPLLLRLPPFAVPRRPSPQSAKKYFAFPLRNSAQRNSYFFSSLPVYLLMIASATFFGASA